ncbi:ATP-binding cassette domain-containing protein [Mycoplasmopsis columbinasalis]|uniref:ABC transporter ATP-binding protein n=1 Tax=Mycoplasmopsis columbinasalis TaxID=114880 RepID=A0A449B9P5_9BACT|nr:ATP-binding cassette domain-containing protein [Mycoplasmopsis columbinasalis]VEU77887.1 ABC transporter ATP-binding protein [Mycoplasmopsis columbinasalis]
MTTIKLENLTLKYANDQDNIVENINVTFRPGEMVAIIGASGVGKSTLFKALVRQLQPATGKVIIFDQDINQIQRKVWANTLKHIGFLTQKPNLIVTDTVMQNILRSVNDYENWFFKLINFVTIQQRKKILSILDKLGMIDKTFFRISELSGGQQQRVEIAKLLFRQSKIILADEPTSSLDFNTATEVLNTLNTLKTEQQLTILVNIHDLSLINSHFDRVLGLKNKQIVLDAPIDKITQQDLESVLN